LSGPGILGPANLSETRSQGEKKMKSKILVLLLVGLAACAAADKKSDKRPPAPTPTAKAVVIAIPADAVEVAPYTFRSTDAQGNVWIYRQTPFGVSRTEDKPISADEAKKAQDSKDQLIQATSAVEDGDSIRFVRKSPFGRTEWQKKKTDLNEIEQAVWNRELAKHDTPESASKD
jgi:hypothetical protein